MGDAIEPDPHVLAVLQARILQRIHAEAARMFHQQAHARGLTAFDRALLAQHHRDVERLIN